MRRLKNLCGAADSAQRNHPRWLRLLATLALLVTLAACVPIPTDGTYYTYADSEQAIHEAFDPYGQAVYEKARRIAACESGLWPYSGSTKANPYYRGVFQLGRHIVAINVYGGDFYNPYQNALAARDLWLSRGNWTAWPWCGRV